MTYKEEFWALHKPYCPLTPVYQDAMEGIGFMYVKCMACGYIVIIENEVPIEKEDPSNSE